MAVWGVFFGYKVKPIDAELADHRRFDQLIQQAVSQAASFQHSPSSFSPPRSSFPVAIFQLSSFPFFPFSSMRRQHPSSRVPDRPSLLSLIARPFSILLVSLPAPPCFLALPLATGALIMRAEGKDPLAGPGLSPFSFPVLWDYAAGCLRLRSYSPATRFRISVIRPRSPATGPSFVPRTCSFSSFSLAP